MDNFSRMISHFFYMKSTHVDANQTPVLFLSFTNFLLFNKLSYLIRIMSTNKVFKFLYYLIPCGGESSAIYMFVDNL